VWPLFGAGVLATAWKLRTGGRKLLIAILTLAWLAIPVFYVVARRPPLYDGMRHFLFVAPPIFVFAALALDLAFERIRRSGVRMAVAILVIVPGLIGIVGLHPYEYTYFNALVGGTGGAFRHYETDYWLTCYKEAVQRFSASVQIPVRLFVHREVAVAAPYASSDVTVLDERGAARNIIAGDYLLINSRTNEDQHTFRDAPEVLTVGRAGATFCAIKRIP
jgi:hypothetical protein